MTWSIALLNGQNLDIGLNARPAENGAGPMIGWRTHLGIVKLKLTAVFDAQHGGFTTGWSPVSWGSIDELFVNLTMPGA